MSWLLAFLGFAALIILHELGHFTAAKAVGMRVERFSLFFPPLLARRRRGETEYAIGAIPLGGYVKITGMNPREELPPEVAHRAYYRQPVWKRIVVIGAGPAVNIVLAFLILLGAASGPTAIGERDATGSSASTGRAGARACCSRATGSSPSTACAATPRRCKRADRHAPLRGRAGRTAAAPTTPATVTVSCATAASARCASAGLRRRARSACCSASRYGSRRRDRSAPVEAARRVERRADVALHARRRSRRSRGIF